MLKIDTYKVGDKLPLERELRQVFNASRIPIRQALNMLEEGCIVARKHGVGTYVLPSHSN